MQSLIQKVRVVDEDAGKYLVEDAPNLISFNPSDKLDNLFLWSDTPQGVMYWHQIWLKINGLWARE